MEEPAFKQQQTEPRGEFRVLPQDTPSGERESQDWETKVGKAIFYITVALSIWFFYWLNGIQCPC